ncbi:DNA polymerase III subunit delta' [Catenovulum sp. 2E275]|uniref:DNA polymerase III subunit delta' n=1 Tax=Catenovulum sp. 2E275 TaxID=2980497 RepID=UPI0021CEF7A8|nr:DNA polymerase III subunit delta' [Catenovulum sp. 2E275]MCU4674772.1 DNA polymerase III subunit delta' [Catenovulum sp. 2E275]
MQYPWLNPLIDLLAAQYQQNKLHHALLICGAKGMGKRTFALELAAGLLCEKKTGLPCGQCKSCLLLETQAHPDFFIAEDADAKSIGVDLIRQVVNRAQQKSQLGGALVFYIPDCDKMTEASANALLKTLEEPGNNKYLILTTSAANRLLATIISRCQQYVLKPPKLADLSQWLENQAVDIDAFSQIFAKVNGAPLVALEYAQGDYLTQQAAFLAQFKLLITGKTSAFEFSQTFDENYYLQQLDWLNQAVLSWLGAKLETQVQNNQQAIKRLVISDLLALIVQAKMQMLQSGVNKKIVFQSLCFNMLDKLKS